MNTIQLATVLAAKQNVTYEEYKAGFTEGLKEGVDQLIEQSKNSDQAKYWDVDGDYVLDGDKISLVTDNMIGPVGTIQGSYITFTLTDSSTMTFSIAEED